MKSEIPQQLEIIGNLINAGDETLRMRDASVSQWDIGEHVDHMLKVCGRVLELVEKREAVEGTGINPRGRLVLTLQWIPRGRGKSPEAVVGTKCSAAELEASLRSVAQLSTPLLADKQLHSGKQRIFRHHYFGGLTSTQALRFLQVHNRHHLKIIRAVRRRAGVF